MRKQKFVAMARKRFARPSAKMVAFVGVAATMLVGFPLAFSQDPILNGPTLTPSPCMQTVFGTPVTNKIKLNCTANDIRLAEAVAVSPDQCTSGDTFDLLATFQVNVTANSRYDAGFFFRTDGGDSARGDVDTAAGTCSLSALDPGIPPAEQLDGDTCGDLNSGEYFVTFLLEDVLCEGVPDPTPENPDRKVLKLPNCTSWHNNQATACNADPIVPNNFAPDTKSKCVCDDDFTVPVEVEDAEITVIKTASPTQVPEAPFPGVEVTYNVQVTNDANFESVTITTVMDDIYGDLTDASNPNVTMNTCPDLVGVVLGPGGMDTCSFKAFVLGDAGPPPDVITDVVTVCSIQEGKTEPICDSDDADVTILDLGSDPMLTKTALSAGCTVDVDYQVVVSNNSEVDTLTVDALTDDKFGDLTLPGCDEPGPPDPCNANITMNTCDTECVGVTIDPSGNCTCSFVGRIVSPTCDIDHVDTVTGELTDDDDETYTRSDTAKVTVTTTTE